MLTDRNLDRGRHVLPIYAKDFLGIGAVTGSSANPTFVSATLATTLDTLGLTTGAVTGSAAANTLASATLTTTLNSIGITEAGTPDTLDSSSLTTTLDTLTLTTGAWTGSAAANTLASSTLTTTCSAISMTAGALTAALGNMSASANAITEVSTLSYGGLLFASNAQFVRHLMPVLPQIDWGNDVYFRIAWSSTTTNAAHTILWKILTKAYAADAVPASGAVTVGTSLDVAIATDTKASTTANVMQFTTWGKLNKNTVVPGTHSFFLIDVESLTLTGLTDATLYWLEVLYVPKYDSRHKSSVARLTVPTNA